MVVPRTLRQAAALDCFCGWQTQCSRLLSGTTCLAPAEQQLPIHEALTMKPSWSSICFSLQGSPQEDGLGYVHACWMSVGWHHEGHHAALSKAWSRWTQPARLCPQLCSKLFPRTAAAAARRGTAGLRLRRAFESGGFFAPAAPQLPKSAVKAGMRRIQCEEAVWLQHFLHSAAGFLPRSVARGCLEWDVLNPVTCCLCWGPVPTQHCQ